MANLFNVASASFVTGAPVTNQSGWVVMAMDDLAQQEIEHSAVLYYRDGVFEARHLKMFRTRSALWLAGRGEVLLVGDNGECSAIDANGGDHDEYVTSSQRSPRNTGHLRAAAKLGDEVIAVGMQRQVYRRDGSGHWRDMMQGLPDSTGQAVSGFECVLPVTETEIYAAGWRGELWRFDGRVWSQIESPTNKIITGLSLERSGKILACGQNGLILEGRDDSWRVVHEGECPTDLWSINCSSERTFTAGLRFLFTINNVGSEIVEIDAETFGELVYGADVLWSFGQKDFCSFDGATWSRIA